MWSNIGNVEDHKECLEFTDDQIHRIYRNKAGLEQNLNCASSFKGIFTGKLIYIMKTNCNIQWFQNLGMIMVCVAIIGLILFFTLDKNHAKYVNEVVESLMLLSMITASLWFYFSLYSLDVNPHPISFLDDLLLLICLPAFFTFCVLNAISGIGGERWFIPTNVLSVRLSN